MALEPEMFAVLPLREVPILGAEKLRDMASTLTLFSRIFVADVLPEKERRINETTLVLSGVLATVDITISPLDHEALDVLDTTKDRTWISSLVGLRILLVFNGVGHVSNF